MRKKLIIQLFLGGILFHLHAQIGINTQPLKTSVLHVQGKDGGDVAKDILVQDGDELRLGVGTVDPQASVHIVATGNEKPFQLVDGTQKDSYILQSDKDGFASWTLQTESIVSIDSIVPTTKFYTYPTLTGTRLLSYKIPEDGDYLIIVRWWGIADAIVTTNYSIDLTSAYFRIYEAETILPEKLPNPAPKESDQIEYYLKFSPMNAFTFTTTLFVEKATANNYFSLYIIPSTGGNSWFSGTIDASTIHKNRNHNPSIVICKL